MPFVLKCAGLAWFKNDEAVGENMPDAFGLFLRVKMRASAAVAQLDRVLGYEPRGRGFDSCQPHHFSTYE